jgi:hypothetical protein
MKDSLKLSNASPGASRSKPHLASEFGYALLGMLLALSIISIVLVSSVVPNVKMQVQREKEAELIYRGNQMAKAIARYYGVRTLRPLQLQVPPPYGYLLDLKKLRDGVTIGVQEIKFARASEMIDPMANIEWEPVRARDPRINKVLQAYAAESGQIIPPSYLLLAGPPTKSVLKPAGTSGDSSGSQSGSTGLQPGQVIGSQQGSQTGGTGSGQPAGGVVVTPGKKSQDLDDDDDDDDVNDPLAHLFGSDSSGPGKSTVPIIGVAPKLKGQALKPLYGLDRYEDWVFIYMPVPQGVGPANPNQINNGGGLQKSQ